MAAMNTQTTPLTLVTGGSRGLGRQAALRLAAQGHDVILTYRSRADEADAAVREIEALSRRAAALPLDTGVAASFPEFVRQLAELLPARFGRDTIDHVVNNAGIDWAAPFADSTEAQFDALMNVHFKGVFFLTQALLPQLADGGAIVLVSTGLTRFAIPGYAAYASMKGAVEVLAKNLAKDLGPRRIRCNLVAPGAIETDFTRDAFESHAGMREFIASQTALGRVGQPQDIAGVVALLCSDASGWMNAQRVEASGGMLL
jgi:NAD(P)-dependent dehydrogenase (short-subunit alcohol dehydrogenase family)